MAAGVHLMASSSKSSGLGFRAGDQKEMRFSWAVAIAVAGISVSGWAQQAQQKNTFKVKPSPPERSAKPSSTGVKATGSGTASAASAKELQAAERQSKVPGSSRSAKKTGPALKPVKDKSNPPINFGASGGGKGGGAGQASNPYKGRLKTKGGNHH
jgi:cytoskeletal protein RodZ